MSPPLVSIVTPTFGRPAFLRLLYECVRKQELREFEWLILDDSAQPCAFMQGVEDPRIVYLHDARRKSVGAKRNILVDRARGRIIAHFDDDDYYASAYLSRMVRVLQEQRAAVAKLFGYFLYSALYGRCGYWDLVNRSGPHMVWSTQPMAFATLDEGNNAFLKDNHLGYGFSYVFDKAVWQSAPFPDVDWNEDAAFMKQAVGRYPLAGVQDVECTCLHILHAGNTSRCFPQYLVPEFLLDRLFPDSGPYRGRAGTPPRVGTAPSPPA